MRFVLLLGCLALGLLAGCQEPTPPPPAFVARVGDAYLTPEEMEAALSALPPGLDSLTARQQVVEQWVKSELMAREADARGLRDTPQVQRQLIDSERSVLASALVGALYEEQAEAGISAGDVAAYFERNRERLRLREPYVRVRFIEATTREDAQAARRALQAAMQTAQQDSLWEVAARTYAADTAASLELARLYVPERRLLEGADQAVWAAMGQLGSGQISPIVEADSAFFVLQLVDRAEAGAEPELAWIEDEVRRLLTMQARKQMLARQVERLRSEAEARNELEVRLPGSESTPEGTR